MFSSDSQRRAAFANMGGGNISGLNTVKFARKPSKKLVDDIAMGLDEPVTEFGQVTTEEDYPDHGAMFFPVRNYGGSADAAKADAERIKDMISDDGVVIPWVDPIWSGSSLVGYTIRAKDIKTGKEVLDKDMKVMGDYENV